VGENRLCGDCLVTERYFTRARSVGYYQGMLLDAIHQFKYNGKVLFSSLLGDLLANCSLSSIDFRNYDLLIPVPLHKKRLRERGFNQALLLAGRIKKRWKLPVDCSVLKRIRWTDSQINLSRRIRLKNIKGAFQVMNQGKIKEKKILLVDDVYTTGFTANECSKTLIKSGASRVDVLTLARAV
jgi:ComF family protein